MREQWRAYTLKPRKSGKEGKNYRQRADPPASLRALGVKPIRKSAGTTDRAAAEAGTREWERMLNASILDSEKPTALDVLTKHMAWREATNAPVNTVAAYRAAVRRLGPLSLASSRAPTRAVVLEAQDALLRAQLAPGTVNQTLNCARKAWRWALDREWVSGEWPRVARLPVPETAKRPYTDAEVEAVLAWVASYRGGYWLPLFALLADTGARVGELLRVRGGDVDREAGIVRLGRAKNGEQRVLRPPAATLALLPDAREGEHVFRAKRLGARRGRPLGGRVFLGVLWRALEALGLPDAGSLDLHSFRRSWITSAHEEGVPLNVSMRATGHRSSKVHLDYARRAAHDVGAAVDAVRERRRRTTGERAWEASAAGTTAQTPPGNPSRRRPKSSAFPPQSPTPASCWSGLVDCGSSHGGLRAATNTAPTPETLASERRPTASPFLGGHPLGERIERLFAIDAEAALAIRYDATAGKGIDAYAKKAGLRPAAERQARHAR